MPPPAIILVEKGPLDWEAWARADPERGELLKTYSELVTINDVRVWQQDGDGRGSGPR